MPEEIPPLITTRDFANFCKTNYPFLKGSLAQNRTATKYSTFTAPRPVSGRRNLAVVHPVGQLPALLLVTALAGCATQPPPPVLPRPQQPVIAPPPAPPPVTAPQQPRTIPPQIFAAGPFFTDEGLASFYGRAHSGKPTASGKKFDHRDFTAAHRTLPFGTLIRVTDLANGRTVTVEITDRGPRIPTRIVDLSFAAAKALGMVERGVTRVRLEAFRADQRD